MSPYRRHPRGVRAAAGRSLAIFFWLAFLLVAGGALRALDVGVVQAAPSFTGPLSPGVRYYSPCNCARDTAALNALLSTAAANNVREVQVGPGTLSVTSSILGVSGVVLTLHPQTVLSSTIPYNGADVTAAPLYMPQSATGTPTTLAAAAKVGDTSLSLTASLPTGATCVGSSNTIQCFDITAVSGSSSPYTATISDPFVYAFPNGTAISAYAYVHDFIVNGNGAQVVGSGTTGVEAPKCQRCVFRGLRISVTGTKVASLDVGSRDSGFEDIEADAQATASATPVTWEGCNRCFGTRVRAINSGSGTQCFWLDNVWGFRGRDLHAHNCGSYGIQWSNSPQSGSRITGGELIGNASAASGIIVYSSTTGVVLDGITLRAWQAYGVRLDTTSDDVSLDNLRCLDDYNGGVWIGGRGAYRISNLYTAWTGAGSPYYELYGLVIAGAADVTVNGWTDAAAYYAPFSVGAAATVRVTGFRWSAGAQGGWTGASVTAAAKVSLRSGTIDLGTASSSYGINVTAAATMYVDGLEVLHAPSSSNGVAGGSGATWTSGPFLSIAGATPYAIGTDSWTKTNVTTAPGGHP